MPSLRGLLLIIFLLGLPVAKVASSAEYYVYGSDIDPDHLLVWNSQDVYLTLAGRIYLLQGFSDPLSHLPLLFRPLLIGLLLGYLGEKTFFGGSGQLIYESINNFLYLISLKKDKEKLFTTVPITNLPRIISQRLLIQFDKLIPGWVIYPVPVDPVPEALSDSQPDYIQTLYRFWETLKRLNIHKLIIRESETSEEEIELDSGKSHIVSVGSGRCKLLSLERCLSASPPPPYLWLAEYGITRSWLYSEYHHCSDILCSRLEKEYLETFIEALDCVGSKECRESRLDWSNGHYQYSSKNLKQDREKLNDRTFSGDYFSAFDLGEDSGWLVRVRDSDGWFEPGHEAISYQQGSKGKDDISSELDDPGHAWAIREDPEFTIIPIDFSLGVMMNALSGIAGFISTGFFNPFFSDSDVPGFYKSMTQLVTTSAEPESNAFVEINKKLVPISPDELRNWLLLSPLADDFLASVRSGWLHEHLHVSSDRIRSHKGGSASSNSSGNSRGIDSSPDSTDSSSGDSSGDTNDDAGGESDPSSGSGEKNNPENHYDRTELQERQTQASRKRKAPSHPLPIKIVSADNTAMGSNTDENDQGAAIVRSLTEYEYSRCHADHLPVEGIFSTMEAAGYANLQITGEGSSYFQCIASMLNVYAYLEGRPLQYTSGLVEKELLNFLRVVNDKEPRYLNVLLTDIIGLKVGSLRKFLMNYEQEDFRDARDLKWLFHGGKDLNYAIQLIYGIAIKEHTGFPEHIINDYFHLSVFGSLRSEAQKFKLSVSDSFMGEVNIATDDNKHYSLWLSSEQREKLDFVEDIDSRFAGYRLNINPEASPVEGAGGLMIRFQRVGLKLRSEPVSILAEPDLLTNRRSSAQEKNDEFNEESDKFNEELDSLMQYVNKIKPIQIKKAVNSRLDRLKEQYEEKMRLVVYLIESLEERTKQLEKSEKNEREFNSQLNGIERNIGQIERNADAALEQERQKRERDIAEKTVETERLTNEVKKISLDLANAKEELIIARNAHALEVLTQQRVIDQYTNKLRITETRLMAVKPVSEQSGRLAYQLSLKDMQLSEVNKKYTEAQGLVKKTEDLLHTKEKALAEANEEIKKKEMEFDSLSRLMEYEKEQQYLIEAARQELELNLKSAEDEVTRRMKQLSEEKKRARDHEHAKWQFESQAELWHKNEETYKSEVEELKKDIKAANEKLKKRQDLYEREISIASERHAVEIKEMERKITEETSHVETLSAQLDELKKARERDCDDYKKSEDLLHTKEKALGEANEEIKKKEMKLDSLSHSMEYEKEQRHHVEGARKALEFKLKSAEDEATRTMQKLSEETKRVRDHEHAKRQFESQAELWHKNEEAYKSEVEGLKKDIKAANEELKKRQDLYERKISIASERHAVVIKEMEQKNTEETSHVETLSAQLDELQKARERGDENYKKLRAEIDKVEKRVSTLTASESKLRKILQGKKTEIEGIKLQLSEMTTLAFKKERELRREHEDHTTQLNRKEENVSRLQEEVLRYKDKIESEQAEVSQLKFTIESLTSTQQAMTAEKKEIIKQDKKHQEESDKLRKKLTRVAKKNESLGDQLKKEQRKVSIRERRWLSLDAQVEQLKKEKAELLEKTLEQDQIASDQQNDLLAKLGVSTITNDELRAELQRESERVEKWQEEVHKELEDKDKKLNRISDLLNEKRKESSKERQKYLQRKKNLEELLAQKEDELEELTTREESHQKVVRVLSEQHDTRLTELKQKHREEVRDFEVLTDQLEKLRKTQKIDRESYHTSMKRLDEMGAIISSQEDSELNQRLQVKEKEKEIRKLQQQLTEMTSLISKNEEKVARGEVERLNMEDHLKRLKEEKGVAFKQLSEQERLARKKEKDLSEQLEMAVAAKEALRVESQREIERFKKEKEEIIIQLNEQLAEHNAFVLEGKNEVQELAQRENALKKSVSQYKEKLNARDDDQVRLSKKFEKLRKGFDAEAEKVKEMMAARRSQQEEMNKKLKELLNEREILAQKLSEQKQLAIDKERQWAVERQHFHESREEKERGVIELEKSLAQADQKIIHLQQAEESAKHGAGQIALELDKLQTELNKQALDDALQINTLRDEKGKLVSEMNWLKEHVEKLVDVSENERQIFRSQLAGLKLSHTHKEQQWSAERERLHDENQQKANEAGVLQTKLDRVALELQTLKGQTTKDISGYKAKLDSLLQEEKTLTAKKSTLEQEIVEITAKAKEEQGQLSQQLAQQEQLLARQEQLLAGKKEQWSAERERLHDENQQKANEAGVLKTKLDRVALELQTLKGQTTKDISGYKAKLSSLLQEEKTLTAKKSALEQEKAQISEHNDELRVLIEKQSEDMKQQARKLSELQSTKDVALSFGQQLRQQLESHTRQLEGHPHSLPSSPDVTLRVEQRIESASAMNSLQDSGMAIVQNGASPLSTQSEVSSRMPERRGRKRGANAQLVPVRKSPRLALVADTTRQYQFDDDESTDRSDNLSDSESWEMNSSLNSDDTAAQESLPSSPVPGNVVIHRPEKRGHIRSTGTEPVKSPRLVRVAETTQEAQPDASEDLADKTNDVEEESAFNTELLSQELKHAFSLMRNGDRVRLGIDYMKQRMAYPNLPELLDKSTNWTVARFRYAVYKYNQRPDMLDLKTLTILRPESKEYYNAVSDYLVYFKPSIRDLVVTWNNRREPVPVPGNGVFLSGSVEKWSMPHFNFMLWQKRSDHLKADNLDVLAHMFSVINPVEIQDDYNRLILDYLMFSFSGEEGDIDLTSPERDLMLKRAVKNIHLRDLVMPTEVQGKRFYFNKWNSDAVKEYLTRYGVTFLLRRTKTRGELDRLRDYAESNEVEGYKEVLRRIGIANGYKYSDILSHYSSRNKKGRIFPFIPVEGLTLDTHDAATLFLTFVWAFGLSKEIVTPAGRDTVRDAFRKITRQRHPELYQQLMILVARTYQKPARFMYVMKSDNLARPDNQAWTIKNASEMMKELLPYEQNKESR